MDSMNRFSLASSVLIALIYLFFKISLFAHDVFFPLCALIHDFYYAPKWTVLIWTELQRLKYLWWPWERKISILLFFNTQFWYSTQTIKTVEIFQEKSTHFSKQFFLPFPRFFPRTSGVMAPFLLPSFLLSFHPLFPFFRFTDAMDSLVPAAIPRSTFLFPSD